MSKQIDPKQELLNYKEIVERELRDFFIHRQQTNVDVSEFSQNVFASLVGFNLIGGKRLRPSLIFHSYKLFGGTEDQEIIKLSTFMELLQSFFLIHDDIFDNADLRRGLPSMNKSFQRYAEDNQYKGAKHFGEVISILNGDIACQIAFEIIADSNIDNNKKAKLLKLVAQKNSEVLFGQIEDFMLSYNKNFNETDIIKVLIHKTATYTFEMPLLSGAILADANEADADNLKEYAIDAGVAFQIRDDILGVFGDEEKLGKSACSDIREGKKTFLILHVLNFGNDKHKKLIHQYLGKSDFTENELMLVREVLIDSGSLASAKQKCEEYVNNAKAHLFQIKKHEHKSWKFLNSLADYMVVRDI